MTGKELVKVKKNKVISLVKMVEVMEEIKGLKLVLFPHKYQISIQVLGRNFTVQVIQFKCYQLSSINKKKKNKLTVL